VGVISFENLEWMGAFVRMNDGKSAADIGRALLLCFFLPSSDASDTILLFLTSK
jgi:hypothetical protein